MFDRLRARRARIAHALALTDEVLLIGAGQPVPLPEGTDQTYPFRSHAEFFHVAGSEIEGAVVAYDPREGPEAGWRCFVPTVTEADVVWCGKSQLPGDPIDQLASWLAARANRPRVVLGAPMAGVTSDSAATARVHPIFHHARRVKDDIELAILRRAADMATAGYAALRPLIHAGVSERQLQIELEVAFFRSGATGTGYASIIGTGPNAAVLHFPPSSRTARPGEFVLVDAGPELDRYVIDVTRTYVAGGDPTPFQRDLHAVVLAAEEAAIARCLAGTEWKDVHLACAVEMTAGLVSMGVMRGDPASLVEQEAHTLFFPHGLGHLVGLGVRDASGVQPGRVKDPRPCLRTLRCDLPLQPGYVITVEPGLYFIPALLDQPANRERFRDCVNWELADAHRHLGGVRIEDNVLVTTGTPEVLTAAIPRDL